MSNPTDVVELSPEQIEESWFQFLTCEIDGKHEWCNEPDNSVFYRRCTICGGAEGIRFPKGFTA